MRHLFKLIVSRMELFASSARFLNPSAHRRWEILRDLQLCRSFSFPTRPDLPHRNLYSRPAKIFHSRKGRDLRTRPRFSKASLSQRRLFILQSADKFSGLLTISYNLAAFFISIWSLEFPSIVTMGGYRQSRVVCASMVSDVKVWLSALLVIRYFSSSRSKFCSLTSNGINFSLPRSI